MLWLTLAAQAADPIALVELYTSQGCSSCPPADALLAQIDADAEASSHPVHVLSFHVDYWDRLGWKDPYGSPDWTARQRAYGRQFGSHRLYTPQVVVNGVIQGGGNSRAFVKGAIAKGLTKDAVATVEGTARRSGNTVSVEVTAKNAPIGGLLYAAIVEPHRENDVPRGENRGRPSAHTNVVRALAEGTSPGLATSLTLPADVAAEVEVVAWVVDPLSGAVVGASAVPVGR